MITLTRYDKTARDVYLSILCAEKYPEQCPTCDSAKWYDLLWFLIPIAGVLVFIISIEERYKEGKKK